MLSQYLAHKQPQRPEQATRAIESTRASSRKRENQTSLATRFQSNSEIELTLVPIEPKQRDSYEVYFCGICLGIVAQTCLGGWINSLPSMNATYSEPLDAAEALYQAWDFQQEQNHSTEVDGV